jgi:hypothetical protein
VQKWLSVLMMNGIFLHLFALVGFVSKNWNCH